MCRTAKSAPQPCVSRVSMRSWTAGMSSGSDTFNEVGARMAETMTKELLFIGTVIAPAPMIHNNDLINFTETKTHSYEYYRTYPYRATQWWLDE